MLVKSDTLPNGHQHHTPSRYEQIISRSKTPIQFWLLYNKRMGRNRTSEWRWDIL